MQFKARIKNLAAKNKIPALAVLQSFIFERFLDRLSHSSYCNKVILKGGLLIAAMVGINHRTTMDMDATLRGYPLTEESIQKMLTEVCALEMGDEVKFVINYTLPIRDDDQYGGYRAAITGQFESIAVPFKLDITTGDVITPEAIEFDFRSIFEDKIIEIWAYNIETILAEKVETILKRSVLNTRPRDFYDVYILTRTKNENINKGLFLKALNATAEKRMSQRIMDNKAMILNTIQSDTIMNQRWDRYCKENAYARSLGFDEVIKALVDLVNS